MKVLFLAVSMAIQASIIVGSFIYLWCKLLTLSVRTQSPLTQLTAAVMKPETLEF